MKTKKRFTSRNVVFEKSLIDICNNFEVRAKYCNNPYSSEYHIIAYVHSLKEAKKRSLDYKNLHPDDFVYVVGVKKEVNNYYLLDLHD